LLPREVSKGDGRGVVITVMEGWVVVCVGVPVSRDEAVDFVEVAAEWLEAVEGLEEFVAVEVELFSCRLSSNSRGKVGGSRWSTCIKPFRASRLKDSDSCA
jgi:hypothetical protein